MKKGIIINTLYHCSANMKGYRMSITVIEQVKRFCRYQGIMCEYATDMGYCRITGCAKLYELYGAYKGGKEYEKYVEQMEHDIMYEPTYNPEDGSM